MIQHDGTIDIAVGMSADSSTWRNKKMTWDALRRKLAEETRTNETLKEYLSATKQEQSKIKDVGGYVGGYLRNGKRRTTNVAHRQLATLDIDFAHSDFWDDFAMQFDNAAVLHATHKHSPDNPRLRLIMPLSRECTPDEYVAVTRRIAGDLGIDLFDNTTFQPERLMFWPSNPKDIEYYYEFQDGPWIDVDSILDSYVDWKDSSAWPTAEARFHEVHDRAKKQEDPELKRGSIGAFCRTYSISEAIKNFLSDCYTEAGPDRYTYVKGSTSGGMMVYDDKFSFSHHGTDPSSNILCNAFDLVRIHKFGHLDSEGNSKKSFQAMETFALNDKMVKKTIAAETIANAKFEFSDESIFDEENLDPEDIMEDNLEWMERLETDPKGNYLSTAPNITLIIANDKRLKGAFKQNEFDNKRYAMVNLPWRRVPSPEPMKNVDYSGVRNYIESVYGVASNFKVEDALSLEIEKNSFHPIKDYLLSLKWDGIQRVDTLLVDFFGAPDNAYTREAIRKMLVGAVARVFTPGIKFDLVLTLVGGQGAGKSTFIKKLGRKWFSDTFMTVQGKEALEQIQGAWIIEMAELSGLRKAEVEAIKHFISKQEDSFRPAYARTSETYMRQCVFFGTTNSTEFLRDPSGNRRFMPIDVNRDLAKKCIFAEFDEIIDQVWAEAVHLWRRKEPLFLSQEAEAIALNERKSHSEADDRTGLIENYLNTPLPKDWDSKDLISRRIWLTDELSDKGTIERDYVCIAELWCECLGKEKEDMSRYNTREVNDMMKSLDEWEYVNSTRNFKLYGKQKYFQRKL